MFVPPSPFDPFFHEHIWLPHVRRRALNKKVELSKNDVVVVSVSVCSRVCAPDRSLVCRPVKSKKRVRLFVVIVHKSGTLCQFPEV